MARIAPEQVEAQLLRLATLDREELIAAWEAAHGAPPPKKMSRDLLMKGIAYELQCEAFGGLPPQTRRMLEQIAAADRASRGDDSRDGSSPGSSVAGAALALAAPALTPGSRLIRVYRGETHEVEVAQRGFRWQDTDYPSLSVIARAITGTRRNGPAFFGLREMAAGNAPRRSASPSLASQPE